MRCEIASVKTCKYKWQYELLSMKFFHYLDDGKLKKL